MRRSTLGLGLTAGAVVAMLIGSVPAQATGPLVFSKGHLDIVDVAYEAGALEVGVHDEDNDVEYAADEVLLRVKRAAQVAVPADPAYAFLGAPGDIVSILPGTQNPDIIWPGFASEEVPAGVFQNDELRIRLVEVDGPGDLAVYSEDPFGAPTLLFDSGDGLPDVRTFGVGLHEHDSWAFDEPGRYEVTFRVTGRLAATGELVRSDLTTYRFQVQR